VEVILAPGLAVINGILASSTGLLIKPGVAFPAFRALAVFVAAR